MVCQNVAQFVDLFAGCHTVSKPKTSTRDFYGVIFIKLTHTAI